MDSFRPPRAFLSVRWVKSTLDQLRAATAGASRPAQMVAISSGHRVRDESQYLYGAQGRTGLALLWKDPYIPMRWLGTNSGDMLPCCGDLFDETWQDGNSGCLWSLGVI